MKEERDIKQSLDICIVKRGEKDERGDKSGANSNNDQ